MIFGTPEHYHPIGPYWLMTNTVIPLALIQQKHEKTNII
jgi:hypothetical protein